MIEIRDTISLARFIEANGVDAFGCQTHLVKFLLQDVGWVVLFTAVGDSGLVAFTRYRDIPGVEHKWTTQVLDLPSLASALRQMVIDYHRSLLPDHAFVSLTSE